MAALAAVSARMRRRYLCLHSMLCHNIRIRPNQKRVKIYIAVIFAFLGKTFEVYAATRSLLYNSCLRSGVLIRKA